MPSGLEAVYLENRAELVRFLTARGAGEAAEDLVNDLWIKVRNRPAGPIAAPMPYLYRAADALMVDRFRSRSRSAARDREWADANCGSGDGRSDAPSGERVIGGRQEVERILGVLRSLGSRREVVFRRTRLEAVPQRLVAAELGVSLSTVESDLRVACRALAEAKARLR